jgi:outer membrane receptor protein involved in Fe transport
MKAICWIDISRVTYRLVALKTGSAGWVTIMLQNMSVARLVNRSIRSAVGRHHVLSAALMTSQTNTHAIAQQSSAPGDTLAEIVVTAEKHESTVQKAPLSITAIAGEDLQARGLTSAQDLVRAVPGVAVSSPGPGQAQYEIRGLSAAGGESPTIGFYLNETPITLPAAATTGKSAIDPDLYDLARVEVLRGPQGTLYGAGSLGGTVKLVTNSPDPSGLYGSAQTTVSGTAGGGLNYGEKPMIILPLFSDVLALRIVGAYGYTSGWIDRIVVPDFPLESNGGLTRGNVLASLLGDSSRCKRRKADRWQGRPVD